MTKKPSGINLEQMTPDVLRLWELGQVLRLAPRELAPYVGVPVSTLYYWFAGMKPRKAHERQILAGVAKVTEKVLFHRGVTQASPRRPEKAIPAPPPEDAPLFQEEFLTVGEFRVFAKALVGTLEDVVEMVKRTALGKVG